MDTINIKWTQRVVFMALCVRERQRHRGAEMQTERPQLRRGHKLGRKYRGMGGVEGKKLRFQKCK